MTETTSSVLAKESPTSHGTSRSSVLHVCTSCRVPGSPREPRDSRAGFKLYQELRATFHDLVRLDAWLAILFGERGVDIFRMKGFISLAGESQRGVHMLFDGQPDREWGDAPRRNQLVFSGRNLDEQRGRQGAKHV